MARIVRFCVALCIFLASAPAGAGEPASAARDVLHAERSQARSIKPIGPVAAKLAEAAARVRAAGDKADPTELDAVSEDPITLRAAAAALLPTDRDTALWLFRHALQREELHLYEDITQGQFAEALLAEAAGDSDKAKAAWEASFEHDVLTAYFLLTRESRHPQRAALLQAARKHLESLVARAKTGEAPHFYTTGRGNSRTLTTLSNDEALAAFRAGESLRYVYIDQLDLTGQTFEQRVSCSRCVFGSIRASDAKFADQLDLRGFVLGDANFGKGWTGEVNRSRSIPPAQMTKVLFDKLVVFGNLGFDSVHVTPGTASFPFVVVEGDADYRNTVFDSALDVRFMSVGGRVAFRGAQFRDAAYLGHLHAGSLDFTRATSSKHPILLNSVVVSGDVTGARCEVPGGLTLEDALVGGSVRVHHCRIGGRLNLSRARLKGDLKLSYVEVDDVEMFGTQAHGAASLSDSVVHGNARFAVDGLNRRLHLADARPLHTLYKQYQGDVDADQELTSGSQYGVLHVDDLAADFRSDVSFANTIFEQFVGFEGVRFGQSDGATASFYNTQLLGESHFERARFAAVADFRTISANELSFNGADFQRAWMLDDANVTGRLSVTDVTFGSGSNLSFYGARLAFFGVTMDELGSADDTRLFYQRCVETGEVALDDARMLEARWDPVAEAKVADGEAKQRAHAICRDRVIGEFVVLRDTFTKRGMTTEADWAYWSLRHYTNYRTRKTTEGLEYLMAWVEWVAFENAFGWGVHLTNLIWSSLVVILIYMLLIRLLCGEMRVDWDDDTISLAEMPMYALFVISLHSFLGRARDWKSRSSNKVWKVLYTTEMIIGIVLITFFIGAYARIILR